MTPESPAPDSLPCPGCGLPRAGDPTAACPVCALTGPTLPEPPPPPPPPPPEPAPPATDRYRLAALLLLVALVSGGLGWWAGRATAPVAAAPEPAAEAPPPTPVAVPTRPSPTRPTTPATRPSPPRDLPRTERSATNGIDFVLVPAGSFRMGSWEHEAGRQTEEAEHPVRISRPFYLGAHEVTQAQYRGLMGSNPSWFAEGGGGALAVRGHADTFRFPVERVTWYDAAEYCNRLSKADGYDPYYAIDVVTRDGDSIAAAKVAVRGGTGYRLPTEAEWEYACRAGTKSPFHFGTDNTGVEANVKASMVAGGYGGATPRWRELARTAPVGSFPPNRWGLFDMHGNVAEWCHDWYERGDYVRAPDADPTGPAGGTQKVQRGGSWLVGEAAARSACRFAVGPANATSHGGFRVARTP